MTHIRQSIDEQMKRHEQYVNDKRIHWFIACKIDLVQKALPSYLIKDGKIDKIIYPDNVQKKLDEIDGEMTAYIARAYPETTQVYQPN